MAKEFDPFAIAGVGREAEQEKKIGRKIADEGSPANLARDQLRAFVERIERLEEDKKEVGDFIKDVYGEAKSMGFDTKILKKVIALRKMDEGKRREEDLILDTYLQALGMIADE